MIDDTVSGKPIRSTASLLNAPAMIIAESASGDPMTGLIFEDADGEYFAAHWMVPAEALVLADTIRKIAERQIVRGVN